MTKKSLFKRKKKTTFGSQSCTFPGRVFFLFSWTVASPSRRLAHHLSGQSGSSVPKTHTRLKGSFSCLRHAWAASSAGFICCQIWKWARVFVSLQLKRKTNIIKPASVCNLWHKSLLYVAWYRQPLICKRLWQYLPGLHPGNTAVCIYQFCFVFSQDVHLEVGFTLWRTRGTQIWENPSVSCTASSATANL